MEEKQADNKIISNKKEIHYINSQIDDKKDELKSLDDLHSHYISINKNISKCIELIRDSIKGGNIDRVLDSMEVDNNKNINKVTDTIEEDKEKVQKEIKKLIVQKEILEDKIKKEQKEEIKK